MDKKDNKSNKIDREARYRQHSKFDNSLLELYFDLKKKCRNELGRRKQMKYLTKEEKKEIFDAWTLHGKLSGNYKFSQFRLTASVLISDIKKINYQYYHPKHEGKFLVPVDSNLIQTQQKSCQHAMDKRDKPNDQTPTLKEQIEDIVQRIKDVTSSKGITLDEAIYMIKARCTQLQNEAKQQECNVEEPEHETIEDIANNSANKKLENSTSSNIKEENSNKNEQDFFMFVGHNDLKTKNDIKEEIDENISSQSITEEFHFADQETFVKDVIKDEHNAETNLDFTTIEFKDKIDNIVIL